MSDTGRAMGGCLCGAVRYEIAAEPTHRTICHCRTCRHASAAPMVAWVTAPRAALRITSGAPREYASSPEVVRTFCKTCGTPLTYTHERRPDEVDVTTCSLDQPEAYAPTQHVWASHRLAWLSSVEELPVQDEAGS